MVWLKFIICLAIIILAGSRLAKYGDLIAEKTGLGRIWIGVVLLATITSFPELANGISAVTLAGEPDLTMGDLFGSNLVNLMIIAVIDVLHTRGPILHFLGTGIVLTTILGVILIAAAAAFLYLNQSGLPALAIGHVGFYSVILFGLYLMAQYMLFRFQTVKQEARTEEELRPLLYASLPSMKRLVAYCTLAAIATIGAGIWLAIIGKEISLGTGLNASFVGTLFLAISTSAPEIVVSISAVRLGVIEMAVGNVVGSNIFNMGVVIFVSDLFYTRGPLLRDVGVGHILTALFGILMSGVVIIGIIFRPRFWLRSWVGIDTAALIILYVGAMVALYTLGRL